MNKQQFGCFWSIKFISDLRFVARDFVSLQVMSKNCVCRFLHGTETSRHHVSEIEGALASREELKVEVTLHKKTGACDDRNYD